jgi:hypothetical protein
MGSEQREPEPAVAEAEVAFQLLHVGRPRGEQKPCRKNIGMMASRGQRPQRWCRSSVPARTHPELSELIWAWSSRSEEMIGGVDAGSVEVLRAVRAGPPCYPLTNMEAETYPHRLKRFPLLGWSAR